MQIAAALRLSMSQEPMSNELPDLHGSLMA